MDDFDTHCNHNLNSTKNERRGYDLHNWPFKDRVLVGCLRTTLPSLSDDNPCKGLNIDSPDSRDTRLFIVKPAVSNKVFALQTFPSFDGKMRTLRDCWVRGFKGAQNTESGILNCDTAEFMAETWDIHKGDCQVFPQHSTVGMTLNSNDRQFSAYRELARQQVVQSLLGMSANNKEAFEVVATQQRQESKLYQSRPIKEHCKTSLPG